MCYRTSPRRLCALVLLAAWLVSCTPDPGLPPRPLGKTATLEVFAVSATNVPGAWAVTEPGTKTTIYLRVPPIIAAADIATVQGLETELKVDLVLTLTTVGASKLTAATTPATGQKLAIVANGRVIVVAPVRNPLSNQFTVAGFRDGETLYQSLTR